MLKTYFARLDDTLATLKPMASSCAGTDNTVIVMVCNTGQSDLLINFVCAAKARGFGDVVTEKVLVFATDEGVLKIAQGLGLRAFYDDKIFEKMPEKEAGRYGDRAFTQMMYAKVVTVQLINHLGYDVLFQDVDLVWYKNPVSVGSMLPDTLGLCCGALTLGGSHFPLRSRFFTTERIRCTSLI